VKPGSLSRAAGRGPAAAPVRLLHLGLGNFFRAHQAWYTDHAPDAPEWGYAAFAGRGSALAERLAAQEGVYTLVTRAGDGDRMEVVGSLSRVHPATDHDAWLGYFGSSDLSAVTLTVTEAGYARGPDGGLAADSPGVRDDLEVLRRDPAGRVRTAPGRLVAGFAARRRADAGPLALVPCDNLPGNGAVAERLVRELAELVDPALAVWFGESVSIVTTMVDRITPRPAREDVRTVLAATGRDDSCPVVTEPFSEWVLSGAFPAGRPGWEAAGATFSVDVAPYERRKLWLLNGGHSLLAYGGSLRGRTTVAEAVADDTCLTWLHRWWSVAAPQLGQPEDVVAAYRAALLERFANPRIRHLLAQIAADGSQKLPVRILPVLRAERSAGRMPQAAIFVLAAWISHLRGMGAPVSDTRAADLLGLAAGPLPVAVRRVLGELAPDLGADDEVVAAVAGQSEQLARESGNQA
jgi:fructuronate reductase